MTTDSAPATQSEAPLLPEQSLGESLAAARKAAQDDVEAAQAKLAAIDAHIGNIPISFHGFSLSAMKAEIESWFAKI